MMQKHILCLTDVDESTAGGKESRKMSDSSFAFKTWI